MLCTVHDAAMLQRSGAPAAQRSSPPAGYNEEIANLREQVSMLRRMQVCMGSLLSPNRE
jgi:hypothetical protein